MENIYTPIDLLGPMAPEGLLKLISCGCKTDCSSNHCSCVKANLKCLQHAQLAEASLARMQMYALRMTKATVMMKKASIILLIGVWYVVLNLSFFVTIIYLALLTEYSVNYISIAVK